MFKRYGRVVSASGITLSATGLALSIGDVVKVKTKSGHIYGEVIGVFGDSTNIMVYGNTDRISVDSIVYGVQDFRNYVISDQMLGSVVNCFGEGLLENVNFTDTMPLGHNKLAFSNRAAVSEILDVGVSAINSMITVGKGQRLGIFAGSGVGKSVLQTMIAKNVDADICVCALIGERSREVIDFVEKTLNAETRKKTIVVSAPADTSPLEKIRATEYAMRIAEHYRDTGKDVVLLYDSLTRYAHALRAVGLANNEPPTMKGYPPSVFTVLPQFVERSGNARSGSITSLFTVLMDGDDETDPVVDSARAILDGHIMLSRELAAKGVYPAIDISKSISRCMTDLHDDTTLAKANRVKSLYSTYKQNEELLAMGAYQKGANSDLDDAIRLFPAIMNIVKQKPSEVRNINFTRQQLFSF